MNTSTKVLIVGAGAGGSVVGYYFAQGGAQVTFFVRPERVAQLQPPMALYSYDDAQLKQFSNYQLISDITEISAQSFDYILLSIDGTSLRAEANQALLAAIGQAAVASKSVVVSCAVGANIRDLVKQRTSLPDEQVICGTFNLLSHFVPMPSQVMHPDIDQHKLSQARLGYRHIGNKGGLMIDKHTLAVSKKFAEAYNKNGFSRVKLLDAISMVMVFNGIFAFYVACELAGWPPSSKMVQHKTLWPLAVKATHEIWRLPEFGFTGKFMSLLFGKSLWRKIWMAMDNNSWPLDHNGFNRLHHGGKVMEQNITILRHHLQTGKQLGKAMPNLSLLLNQVEAQRTNINSQKATSHT